MVVKLLKEKMANALQICRICMSSNIKMFTLKSKNMENLYHLLTQVYVDTDDGKPTTVCFICYARLQQCDRLQKQAIKSNELMEQLSKGGLMATANAILNGQYSSQDLQVSSTYYLDLEPENCVNVLLHPKVEANDLMSVKEDIETTDKGCNVAVLSGQYSSQDLQVPSTYYLELEAMDCEDTLLEPKIEAIDLISVKEEVQAIDERCNVTENCKIQQEIDIRSYPHPSDSIQILKANKTPHNNEEALEINMKSVMNVGKKKSTLTTNVQNCRKSLNNNEDTKVNKKPKKKWKETKANVVSNKQKFQKSINDRNTQEENINRCKDCGEQFSSKDILTDHILKCVKTTEASISDSQLTKSDSVKSLLSERYSCDICTFKTNRKLSIVTHLKMHNVTKVLSCDICEYRCLHKCNLIEHMRTHTGEKPYSCNICEYRFAQKPHLIRHIRTHTGEKPCCCNICEYRCADTGDLIRHIRKHTGEKPFSCNVCDYKCTRKDSLKRHLRTHN